MSKSEATRPADLVNGRRGPAKSLRISANHCESVRLDANRLAECMSGDASGVAGLEMLIRPLHVAGFGQMPCRSQEHSGIWKLIGAVGLQ